VPSGPQRPPSVGDRRLPSTTPHGRPHPPAAHTQCDPAHRRAAKIPFVGRMKYLFKEENSLPVPQSLLIIRCQESDQPVIHLNH
jgi:hypothetical protein